MRRSLVWRGNRLAAAGGARTRGLGSEAPSTTSAQPGLEGGLGVGRMAV